MTDLEAEINARYHRTLQYPDQARKYKRDYETIQKARDVLQEVKNAGY